MERVRNLRIAGSVLIAVASGISCTPAVLAQPMPDIGFDSVGRGRPLAVDIGDVGLVGATFGGGRGGPTLIGSASDGDVADIIECQVPDMYARPWARTWEQHFEEGMTRPEDDDIFIFE
jgi:hypothetical protein